MTCTQPKTLIEPRGIQMRIEIKATAPRDGLELNYVYKLKGVLHKWTGRDDNLHDAQSFYSFGSLNNSRIVEKKRLMFNGYVMWQLSFWDIEVAKRALLGMMRDPRMFDGIMVIEARECPTPNFGTSFRFLADSPILVREKNEQGKHVYLTWDNPHADEVLTTSFRRKLEKAGFSGKDLQALVAFDREYPKAKTKLVEFKGLKHKANACPVWIHGSPDVLKFAWLSGLGDLTGSGFGALR